MLICLILFIYQITENILLGIPVKHIPIYVHIAGYTLGYIINGHILLDVLSVRVPPAELNISAFPPVLRDWVIKGLGMSSRVYATGHIKDPVPLIEKRRGLSPGGRFPPSFIQVILITRLNKLYVCMFSP